MVFIIQDNILVGKKKGRPAAISDEDLFLLFIEYNKQIFVNDTSTDNVSCNNYIWKCLEDQVNGKLNSKTLYMCLSKNRKNIKDKLLKELNKVNVNDSNILHHTYNETSSETDDDSISIDNNYSDTDDKISFKLVLSYNEYIKVKPEVREYKRGPYNKEYYTLKPNFWSSFIYEKIWSTSKIQCNYTFKKNNISGKNSIHFIDIFGKCKDCGGNIRGWTLKEPTEFSDWIIEIEADFPKLSRSEHNTKGFVEVMKDKK